MRKPPKNIDVMLMEGSSLDRLTECKSFPTEKDLERTSLNASRPRQAWCSWPAERRTSTAS